MEPVLVEYVVMLNVRDPVRAQDIHNLKVQDQEGDWSRSSFTNLINKSSELM